MPSLKLNILANFLGSAWTGLMGIVFVPIYIHFMGIEAYGLVGVFAGLQGIFALLDMGLSNTLNREMARLSVHKDKAQEMRDLVRTLEIPYWIVGLFVTVIVILAAPFIAFHWVNLQNLSPETVKQAIMIMGFCFAFQWPTSFYSGGLMGLQRQVLLNTLNSSMATLRGIGAIIVLWAISPTVQAFFLWQMLSSVLHTSLMAFFLWQSLPLSQEKARFKPAIFHNIWRFAGGVTGITILATLLTQSDKIILTRMLTMEMFGYYTLAYTVSSILYRFVYPVSSAVYPRFSNLVALKNMEEIKKVYHISAQLVSVLTFPAAAILAFFSKEILLIWTQNPMAATHTHSILSILTIGTVLNGIMTVPYVLQLAFGWPSLAFWVNLVSVTFLIPSMIFLTKFFGVLGAASVWVILNGGYIIFAIQIMHKRLLRSEKWRWYLNDVGLPFLAAFTTAGFMRLLAPNNIHSFIMICYLILASLASLTTSALTTNIFRERLQAILNSSRATNAFKF